MSAAYAYCPCGRTWTREEWKRLRLVGHQLDYAGALMELRDCVCGSTRSVLVEIDDHPKKGQRR